MINFGIPVRETGSRLSRSTMRSKAGRLFIRDFLNWSTNTAREHVKRIRHEVMKPYVIKSDAFAAVH